jgi:hypothetical protein
MTGPVCANAADKSASTVPAVNERRFMHVGFPGALDGQGGAACASDGRAGQAALARRPVRDSL